MSWYFLHFCSVIKNGLLLLILFCSCGLFGQAEDDYDYANPYQPSMQDQMPYLFISLHGGPSMPRGAFAHSADFREAPDGFAAPGYTLTGSAVYRVDRFLGIRSNLRFGRYPTDEGAVSADLTENKVGEYQVNADPWNIYSWTFGPEMSINNDQTFWNFYLLGGVMVGTLPGFTMNGTNDLVNNEVQIQGEPNSTSGFSFVFGTEFKYAFTSKLGWGMSFDYSTARLEYRDLEYKSQNTTFDPGFEQFLNTAYSAISVETGIYFYLSRED